MSSVANVGAGPSAGVSCMESECVDQQVKTSLGEQVVEIFGGQKPSIGRGRRCVRSAAQVTSVVVGYAGRLPFVQMSMKAAGDKGQHLIDKLVQTVSD